MNNNYVHKVMPSGKCNRGLYERVQTWLPAWNDNCIGDCRVDMVYTECMAAILEGMYAAMYIWSDNRQCLLRSDVV